jgi:hypothetical protein
MTDLQKGAPANSVPTHHAPIDKEQTENGTCTNPLKRDMIAWLFDTYGGKYGVPRRRGAKGLSEDCRMLNILISPGTFRNIFAGTAAELAEDTMRKLTELFRRAIPGMKSSWFDRRMLGENPLETFKQLCLDAEFGETQVVIRVPQLKQERFDLYKEWLCGLYILYRYTFEINHDDSVTREVLRVWHDPDEGVFKFQLWYVVGGAKPGSSVESFDGSVILVGEMIMFVGVSKDRARSIFWTYDSDDEIQGHFKYCRFGMTVSAKARDDRAPVAACTVCVKLEKYPEDWQWWCSRNSMVIGVDTFKNIIGVDFKGEAPDEGNPIRRTSEQWVGLFIENNPMTKSETEHEAEDRVLRLNLKRFRIRMEHIRTNSINNNKLTPLDADRWEKEMKTKGQIRVKKGNIDR